MLPFNDLPPDINTPFGDMLAFLLRATNESEQQDYDYIRAVAKTFERFNEMPYADMVDVIALCIRYHYFDEPVSRLIPVSDEFISMRDLLDGVARSNGLGGRADD